MAQAILEGWRQHFREVGDDEDKGLSELLVLFRQADTDNSNTLSQLEFVRMCKQLRKNLAGNSSSASIFSDHQIAVCFRLIDVDCSGSITAIEFFDQVRGTPSPRRRAWIDYAFHLVDKDNDGVIEFQEVIDFHDSSDYHSDKVKSSTKGSAKGSAKSTRRSTINKDRIDHSNKTVNISKARKFISHFDRYYWKKKGGEDGERLPVHSDQGIERDGRIFKAEFDLYWANRSFYFEKDESFKKEFLVGWGVDLHDPVAIEYCNKRETELQEQQNVHEEANGESNNTIDMTVPAAELTLSPSKPVPPSDPPPSSFSS